MISRCKFIIKGAWVAYVVSMLPFDHLVGWGYSPMVILKLGTCVSIVAAVGLSYASRVFPPGFFGFPLSIKSTPRSKLCSVVRHGSYGGSLQCP